MRTILVILSSVCVAIAQFQGPIPLQRRFKRDAVGALDIVTNNAQPIHADVKVENMADEHGGTTPTSTEKPCPKSVVPSSIEMGTVFQLTTQNGVVHLADELAPPNSVVTPPKDVAVVANERYPVKSFRKSWPLTSHLDLIRSITRIATLSVLIVSAILEFYPLIQHLFNLYAN